MRVEIRGGLETTIWSGFIRAVCVQCTAYECGEQLCGLLCEIGDD